MKDNEMVSDNELIAEFMDGFRLKIPRNMWHIKSRNQTIDAEEMQYHNSWDWLMPVVEKIERLGYTVYIFDNHCKIWEAGADLNKEPIAHGWSGNVSDSHKLPGTFEAVVEFIRWYNSQSPATIK